jgi:hypothetical protein
MAPLPVLHWPQPTGDDAMTNPLRRAMLVMTMLAAAPAAAVAQAKPGTDAATPERALTQEVLGIFRSVCLASAVSGEAVPDVVARVLGASAAALPANRLRVNERVRETGVWIVTGRQGRYRLNTMEPRRQCGVVAEGVDHDAYLDGTAQIIEQAGTLMPGWTAAGAPRRQSGQRPFGTVTYVSGNVVANTTPPRMLTVTGSAAARTDGRPNTGVITTSHRDLAG